MGLMQFNYNSSESEKNNIYDVLPLYMAPEILRG
jgi:hypothetical protein